MTETTLIAVPCRVITLRVEFGADSGASTLEALVLEAVVGGRRTVKELGELFALPHRLMLDVVHGLWGRGFLAVDFATHALESTQAADAIIGGQEGHPALATTVRQNMFLFDPVTATILPYKQGRERVPHGALEMPLAQGISEDDLPQTELVRAVRQAVDDDQRNDGRGRVLNVSFANPVLSPAQAVRWRTVETVVKRDPATGLVTAVPVTPPPGWGRRALELFRSRVTELVRNRPDSRFSKLLTHRQVLEGSRPESLRALMLDLERLAGELRTAPDARVPGLHDELSLAAIQVLEELDEAGRGRCSAGGVAAGAGVGWVVSHLIESAARQVVLALPEITYDALHPVLPSLELAAKRGVTLVFLWGGNPYAKLEDRVATALFDLQARFPGHVLLEDRSSCCAASVVVSDDRSAYVGSRGVLSGDTGSGILIEPADCGDTPPECVTELLSWARRTYPYWQKAREIALAPADFGRREGSGEPVPDRGRHRVDLPLLDENWDHDVAAYRTRWSAAWGRVLQQLATAVDELHRGAPVVRTVWGGMYVDLAQRLVSRATERLAVLDDRAEPDACGDQLAQRLTELRDKGVVVHLQHPPVGKSPHQADGRYGQLQKRLARERTLRSTKARARAVLSDHEVVVGSHHPLGSQAVNPARGPAPSELGLHIVGTAFAAEFARELGIPDWYGDDDAELPAYLPPLPALDAAPVHDDPWTVLANRRAKAEPAELLRRESAALLLGGTDGGEERRAWARWLLHDAWARGAFMEAYLLAPVLGGPGGMSVDLAAVAVPVEHGPLGYQLYASAVELDTAPAEHRTVALVGAVAEMLLQGGGTGADVCEILLDGEGRDLPPAWARLGAAARACFHAEPAPLPLRDAREWAARQEKLTDTRGRWARLAAELDDFAQITHHFTFQDGEKLHRALFRSDHMLALLREAAGHASPPGPGTEDILALPRGEQEVRAVLDQLAMKLGVRKIEWRNHMAYARKVTELLTEARELAALSVDGADGVDQRPGRLPVLTARQREFARHLDRDWHQLLSEAEALGEPACRPAKALLETLSVLPKVGKEEA
ncbi:hypothetical protein Q5762_34820 [Streptomyces sp. P9(2023)]|uniref:hypothetical protein n=1 Tax=Streptomyces sp. P9(2023) TaxID=3064394 RepID=UPI0028F45BF3|nr:hypothetical protein [Streptomyces sp. P9(2023)]MDT9693411.1 hypothetical protein [Streptomyces sp. P9(2023)]